MASGTDRDGGMSLLLTLEYGPRSQAVSQVRLDQGELVIGRSGDADWQIDDPDMFVSRAHCTVSSRGDGYFVTDTSSSGLFVDDAQAPLGAGNSTRLRNGTRLRLGDYVVGIEMQGATEAARPPHAPIPPPSEASRVAAGFGHDGFFSAKVEEVPPPPRPSGLPDPFEKARPSPFESNQRSDAERHKSPAFDDPFSMEPIATPPAARGNRDASAADGPSDPFGFYSSETAREPSIMPVVSPPPEPPKPAPAKQQDMPPPRAARAPWELPDETEEIGQPARREPELAQRAPPIAAQAKPLPVAPPQAPARPPVSQAVASSSRDDDARAAFLRGLGMDSPTSHDPLAEMEKFGREYRLMLEGLMQLLRKRAEEKGSARVAQTVVGASDVNPLKFMPTVDDVLAIMMRGSSPGFLAGEAAIADSVRDLASHHVRAWRGVQGALRRMIDRFDPSALEQELKSSSGIGTLLAGGKSAKLWELYQKRHREIAQSAETRFLGEIGIDFRDAYEEE